MKLKDLIDAVGDRHDWIHFYSEWSISNNGNIIQTLPVDVNVNDEVDICYYWYHHFDPNINRDEIAYAISQHDYQTFLLWYDRLESQQWTYLPETASIYVGDECIGEVCIAYDSNTFALIDWQESECG